MSGYGIDWGLLQPVDIAGSMVRGYEAGQRIRQQRDSRNALAAYAQNATPQTENALLAVDPGLAARAFDVRHQQGEWQRDAQFRDAYARSVAPQNPPSSITGPDRATLQPGGNTLGYQPNAFMPEANAAQALPVQAAPVQAAQHPAGNLDQGLIPHFDQQAAALAEMRRIDPIRADQVAREHYQTVKSRLDVMHQATSDAIARLANVSNDADYQETLGQFRQQMAQMGVDANSLQVPPHYPGPDGVRALMMSGLKLQDQLAAADRYARLQWNIEDGQADNARQDRNTDSMIADRDARRALTERGQDLAHSDRRYSTDTADRRGRDIAAQTDKRTRDLAAQTDKRVREGWKGRKGGATAFPKTKAEYDALPSGTVYTAPDGSTKKKG